MNTYRFINSKDIREYLQTISHTFDTVTAAYLVWQCKNATMQEKFAAWEEIVQAMPDCAIPHRPGMQGEVPSVHQFLLAYIALQKEMLKNFSQKDGCVFSADFFYLPSQEKKQEALWQAGSALFTDYESCLAYCRRELADETDDKADKVRIRKQPFGEDSNSAAFLTLTADLEPLGLDPVHYCDLDLVFPSLWIDIPTPFCRGDIVWDPSGEPGFPHYGKSEPFVLDYCENWDTACMLRNGGREEIARCRDKIVKSRRQDGDSSDMGAYGFAYREDKGFFSEFGGFANYLNLEYCPYPLEGFDRVLEPLSQCMKGDISVGTLIQRVENILGQTPYQAIYHFCQKEYTKEGLTLSGLTILQEEQKEQEKQEEQE